MQLFSHLKTSKINFNTYGDIDPLAKEFDYVVVANGNTVFTNQLDVGIIRIRNWTVKER